jgi:hypothetical protein
MLLTITLISSLIITAGLIYYLLKQKGNIEDLEIKLKITKEYANSQAKKTLAKVQEETKEVATSTLEQPKEAATQVANKKRRGRKKKQVTV